MTVAALTYLTCLVSAFVPVVNAEAYLLAAGALHRGPPLLVLAIIATLGQMTGKMGFFLLGRGALDAPFLRRRTHPSERWQRWGVRVREFAERRGARPVLCFVSAAVGLPPFAIISVLLGSLRMRWQVFLLLGSAGRFVRFGLLLWAPGALGAHGA